MPKRHGRPKGPEPGYDGHEDNGREPYDDPEEHLEIERRRFRGGLSPTPELYARAREQWYRLPGSLVRPSMDTVVGTPDSDEGRPPRPANPDEKGSGS